MIYGYARCSLPEEKGQDLNRQVRELKAAGAQEIVTEREHGDSRIKKNLDLLLDAAKEGDTLICTEVSRLSRSTQQLCEIVELVKQLRGEAGERQVPGAKTALAINFGGFGNNVAATILTTK